MNDSTANGEGLMAHPAASPRATVDHSSRRRMLQLGAAPLASALTLSTPGWLRAQVKEEAEAVGRPVWWALTVGGAGGISGLMEYFNRGLVNTMLHCGVNNIGELGSEHVQRADEWRRRPAATK